MRGRVMEHNSESSGNKINRREFAARMAKSSLKVSLLASASAAYLGGVARGTEYSYTGDYSYGSSDYSYYYTDQPPTDGYSWTFVNGMYQRKA
jgi:hypothetical protein